MADTRWRDQAWAGPSCTVEHVADEQWEQEMREKYEEAENG